MAKNKQKQLNTPAKGVPTFTVKTPAASSTRVMSRAPEIHSSNGKSVVRAHEQIATVSGSVGFSATKYQVNPGLSIYTWLSGQATGWEKHRVRKFQVVYVPAEAVTTTAGSVYLAFDYDPMDSAPQTLAALSTFETQSNGRVYEKISLDLNCNRAYDGIQAKKIRCGPVGSDLQLYDAASFTVATISCANTDPIGQLWVYYEIELISQQTEPSQRVSPSSSVFNLSANQTFTNTVPQSIAFDEAIMNGLSLTPSSGVITLPCGEYEISGEFLAQDSDNELLTVTASFLVNGAVTSPPQTVYSQSTGATGGGTTVPFHFYYSSPESFTIAVRATLNGAAGTLSVGGDFSRLFIRAW